MDAIQQRRQGRERLATSLRWPVAHCKSGIHFLLLAAQFWPSIRGLCHKATKQLGLTEGECEKLSVSYCWLDATVEQESETSPASSDQQVGTDDSAAIFDTPHRWPNPHAGDTIQSCPDVSQEAGIPVQSSQGVLQLSQCCQRFLFHDQVV